MRELREFRAGKPGFYPDQTVYAAYACAEFGLAFADLDGGTGLVFGVSSAPEHSFRRGRCSYPQNNATASTLAWTTSPAGFRTGHVATLGANIFPLGRHRAHRPRGMSARMRWRISGNWVDRLSSNH
jgi:hypothetical protein